MTQRYRDRGRQAVGRLFLVSTLILGPAFSVEAAGSPRAVVEEFHTTLLSVMKQAAKLQVRGRYNILVPKIQQAFNLPLMTRVASGSGWKVATERQRAEMISAFTRMSAGTYAARFDEFSGQSFRTVGERPGPRGMILVETQIVRPGDTPVTLTYLTRKTKTDWRIVDVLLNGGISELAVRQSEYRRLLRTRGANGLITELNRKASALLQGR